jgi:predicted nucleic acid-binding protein
MFVIDASVVLAWCFDDRSSVEADRALARLETDEALAPAHWPREVANALRTAERRGRMEPSELPRLTALLSALPVRIAPVELATATSGVLAAARTDDLTTYDAAYLHLAAIRGLPVATVDDRLHSACARAGVETVR